jgi:hypothetical protein
MDRVSRLLAQFPGPVGLRPSKRKWFMIMGATGLLTIGAAGQSIASGSISILDWIGVAFFGVCTAGFAYMILFANFELTLDGDGFSWRGGRLSERWRWAEAGDFAVVEYLADAPGASLRKRVGFNDKRSHKTESQRIGELLSSATTRRDCSVPDFSGSSSFGLPMEDLTRLMSQWQARAIGHHHQETN